MVSQQMRAVPGKWHVRAAVLISLAMLVFSGCAGAGQQSSSGAAPTSAPAASNTSMEIIAWTTVMHWPSGQQRPPDVKTFDKIISHQGLVGAVQARLNALQRGVVGGCSIASPTYRYEYRFAANGVTTQDFSGNLDCVTWSVTTRGISSTVADPSTTTLDGFNFMTTLHQLTGMPLPSWWTPTLPAS
jgi:hypothetical protein